MQHTEIKASFEKSLTCVQHSFSPKEFKELRGNVSKCALERILGETKRAQYVGIDSSACGCSVRRTHGLPCAHEIAEYIVQSRPIPLSSVHQFWVTLDMTMTPKSTSTELNPDSVLDMLTKQFQNYDDTKKAQVLKKLTEIVNPGSTFIIEPLMKPTKKRDHKKVDVSTRRNPCAFEMVESQHDSHSPRPCDSIPSKDSGKTKKPRVMQSVTKNKPGEMFSNDFPLALQPYISSFKNVPSDGNCGFWAIAGMMNIIDDNAAITVRKDMIQELYSDLPYYKQMWGADRVEELTEALSCLESCPGKSHWMQMPDMGPLIASTYGVALFHLSKHQCITYLPHRSGPPDESRKEIALGFVNNCHFVQVRLTITFVFSAKPIYFTQFIILISFQVNLIPGHPVPPITPYWRKWRLHLAKKWEDVFVNRLKRWIDIVPPTVITTDVIEV